MRGQGGEALPITRYKFGQEGSALVIALLIMVMLTIMGLAVTSTTETDVQISKNDQFHKRAFYNADSGIYATPKVITECLMEGTEVTISGVTYLGSGGTFFEEIMGFDPHDADKDLRFVLSGFNVDVDVNRTDQYNLVGGGVEFASGAEGIGVGSTGGVAVIYEMDSTGTGPQGSKAAIVAHYRKIIGVPGGL